MTTNKGQPQPAQPPSSLTEPPVQTVGAADRLRRPPSQALSDLELMAYFDGELEEPRRSVVAAFAGTDFRARNKLAGLRVTSAIVRNEGRSLAAADNIADLVMAKISANAAAPAPIYDGAASGPIPPRAAHAAHIIPFVHPQAGAPLGVSPSALVARPAANDNARRIFGVIAALAVAAAAGLAIWSRLGPDTSAPVQNRPMALHTAPAVPPTARSTEAEVDAAMVAPEGDAEHGVEVAAVNFGAHTGSIFFVPSGSIEAKRTTTVVWLADDAGE